MKKQVGSAETEGNVMTEKARDLESDLNELVDKAINIEEERITPSLAQDRISEMVVAEMLLDQVGEILASRWDGEPHSQHISYSLKRSINKNWEKAETAEEYKERHIDRVGGMDGLSFEEWINSNTHRDKEADHHIYTLRMKRIIDDEEYYYVGSTPDVEQRMEIHKRRNGDFSKPTVSFITGEDVMLGKDHKLSSDIDIRLIDVYSMYKIEGESKFHFNGRIRQKERVKALEIAIDKNTVNVLGGR